MQLWILIVVMQAFGDHPKPAIGSETFRTKGECEKAMIAASETPKGKEPGQVFRCVRVM